MTRMRRSPGLALAAIVVVVSLAPAARAQQDTRELTAKREQEAKRACLANQPDRGIELLAELYAETNDPTYIYNQGRCYQQNGRAADALIRFREYLRKATAIDAADKASVERVIGELEQQEQARQAAAAPTSAPTPAATVTSPAPEPRADRRQLRIAGIAVAGLGAVALAGGIYFGLRTQQLSDEVSADAKRMMFSQSKYDEGTRAEILQWVGYAVGGVALATGAVLYVVGAGMFGGETTVSAAPVLGPREAGASVRIRF